MSESKSDGGPAFPHMAADTHRDYRPGMTLLDYFAGQVVASPMFAKALQDTPPHKDGISLGQHAAAVAYAIARRMLQEHARVSDERGE